MPKHSARSHPTHLTYSKAGVDIQATDAFIDQIKPVVDASARDGVIEGIGGFGALFDLAKAGYTDPILVAATDGVGTKLRIAIDTNQIDTIGTDLVAMCVNDIVCQGAEALFFLDYFATGAFHPAIAKRVIQSIARACQNAHIALIGGETAIMPNMYQGQDFDIAGFAVGAVERGRVLPQSVAVGDVLLALPSSGVHANGYSLVRKVVEAVQLDWHSPAPFADDNTTLGTALLTPTRLYTDAVKTILHSAVGGAVHAIVHITGGGISGNVPRVLPPGLGACVDLNALVVPPVFHWLAQMGGIAQQEMLSVFNMGVGLVLVVEPKSTKTIQHILDKQGNPAHVIGRVTDTAGVAYSGALW